MKKMMMGLFVALALLLTPMGLANVFNFNYFGSGVSSSGTLTTGAFTTNVGGTGLSGWEIVGITGQRNGVSISGLVLDPIFPLPTLVDNIQFDNGLLNPFGFDQNGLYYSLVDGTRWNVYSQNYPTGGGYLETKGGTTYGRTITLLISEATNVPERSATALLLIIGFCSMIGFVYKRPKTQVCV